MIDAISHFLGSKAKLKARPPRAGLAPTPRLPVGPDPCEQRFGFTKVFRWPVPAQQTPQPTTVEVVGSFTDWQPVPLVYDRPTGTWQVALHHIQGNHTHRYVLLVDGKPTYDKTCDGLAAPQSPQEAQWQIDMPRGPRVMLLFAQTK